MKEVRLQRERSQLQWERSQVRERSKIAVGKKSGYSEKEIRLQWKEVKQQWEVKQTTK